MGQPWALYFQRYLPLNLESAAIRGHKRIITPRLSDFHEHSILLTNQMTCTCKEVHWSDSSFSLGFGGLFRVPVGSFSPESRSLIGIKQQRPCC